MKMKYCFLVIFIIAFVTTVAFGLTGPKIKIENQHWNFGEVKVGTVKEKLFMVENIGDENLIIEKVYTDCGCTKAEISSKQIAPHESAELKVTYDTTGKAYGEDRKNVYIVSNDPSMPIANISLFAKVVEQESVALTDKLTKIPKITSEQLHRRLEEGEKITVLDVREENEYIERHIPDAIWFPKSKFDRNDEQVLAKLERIDKDKPVVSYCGAGHRSSYVTKKLREKGYNAYNLDGVSFWEKKDYPLVRGPKLPPSQEPSIVYLEEAYEHYFLLFKDIVWIDVRNKDDYEKGHVKGALGIPLSDLEYNLDKIPKDKEVVFYCEGTWDGGKCDASMSAGRILIKNGFKAGKIKVFEDGYGAWKNAGYPVAKGGEHD